MKEIKTVVERRVCASDVIVYLKSIKALGEFVRNLRVDQVVNLEKTLNFIVEHVGYANIIGGAFCWANNPSRWNDVSRGWINFCQENNVTGWYNESEEEA